ncbi:ComF family protein [Bacteroides sp. 519]|uniref:ComF family protein n=1 Tax=Bacteroides sp. 519 TaxID=2302937 RepID=UPI0013D25338|nr:ComF family protein [Bacteroides sp. 519]NDV60504.1 ComF family protein [Bacteroides sp. 519]
MKTWIHSFFSILFPKYCPVCGCILYEENFFCIKCDLDLPRTHFHLNRDNSLESQFWGKVDIQRATAYFYYRKGSPYRELLYALKYRGQKELGQKLGARIATEISESDFFDSIDLLIPVPLHKNRYKERGYNQSEQIAIGISKVTGIPVETGVIIRQQQTETQTRKSHYARLENMEGVFELSPLCNCDNKHVLLIDDIITTGATITSCARVLQTNLHNIKISILAIGFVPAS